MLTFDEAKKIGLNACVQKIGADFVRKHRDTSTTAYGDYNAGSVFCFVGVDDRPQPEFDGTLRLSSRKADAFPYQASCRVSKKTGNVKFLNCVLPKTI